MIKILAACGAGVNSSHQIKSALEEELSNRGYDVQCDAVMVKDVNEDLIRGYDIFTPIASILVQKGPQTKIWQQGQPDFYQLTVGGPYQATGGMGDTLAGMIAGFAGQFPQVGLYKRVVVATHLHSAIAEDLSKEVYVVLPTAISKEIPKWMREICLSNCQ